MKTEVALDLVFSLIERAMRLSAVIKAARAEGRDDLTDDEVAAVRAEDDAARAKLQDFIDSAVDDGS